MQNVCSFFFFALEMVSFFSYHIITKEKSFIIVGVMLAKLLFYILLGTYSGANQIQKKTKIVCSQKKKPFYVHASLSGTTTFFY
jgi:steroid 5-alpha reductase family enzyme